MLSIDALIAMCSNRKTDIARLVLKDLVGALGPGLTWQQCRDGHGTGLIVELGDLGIGEEVEYTANGHGYFCCHGRALLELTDGHYHDDENSDTEYLEFALELRRTGGRPPEMGALPKRVSCLDTDSIWVSPDGCIEVSQVILEVVYLRRSFGYSNTGKKAVLMDCADCSMCFDVKGDASGMIPPEFFAWLLRMIS